MKIFKNFKEKKSFKPDFGAEGKTFVVYMCYLMVHLSYFIILSAGIYGGFLLGVRSVNGLAFFDWENTELIRRIEIQPKHVRQNE